MGKTHEKPKQKKKIAKFTKQYYFGKMILLFGCYSKGKSLRDLKFSMNNCIVKS